MSVHLYMDVHVRRTVTAGLRLRGVDVLTAQEDGTGELPDPELLDRATELGRVLFTQDDDLLREAKRRQQTGESFAGIIYVGMPDTSDQHGTQAANRRKLCRHYLCASTWHYCQPVHRRFRVDCSGQRTS